MAGVQTLGNDQLLATLLSNKPIFVGTTTHAMLMVGMSYYGTATTVSTVLSVDVFDPWPDQGYRSLSPAEATPANRGGVLMFVATASVTELSSGVATEPHLGFPCGQVREGCGGPYMVGDRVKDEACASGSIVIDGVGTTCPNGQLQYFGKCICDFSARYSCNDQVWGEGICPDGVCAILGFDCSGNAQSCGSHRFYAPWGWDGYCCEGAAPTPQFVPCLPGSVPCFQTGTCVQPGACAEPGVNCSRAQ
jgi:hypothetical protein